jgi:hypothetical protein
VTILTKPADLRGYCAVTVPALTKQLALALALCSSQLAAALAATGC